MPIGVSNPAPPTGGSVNPSGTGTGINYIGNLAYATSGAVEVNNVSKSLVKFATGGETLFGKAQFFYAENANDRFAYTVKFNGAIIAQYFVFGPADTNGEHLLSNPVILVIPPFTEVELIALNIENSNSRQQCATFMGQVY